MRIIAPTLKSYDKKNVLSDVIAGLIVMSVSIPISMGYAQIAGLPACYGLYGSIIPILLFSLISTSKQFVIGVDAAPAALVGGALASMEIKAGSDEALQVVPLITLLVAGWLMLFSVLRLGKLVSYISKPVMGGFISGIAMTIILMQIPKLMGHGTVTGELFEMLHGISLVVDEINWVSLALGVATILICLLCKKIAPKFPISVLIMLVGVLLSTKGRIREQYGVSLLSAVEPGLPALHRFDFVGWNYKNLLETSFTIALVITASSLLAENNFANKNGYVIRKNREIFAFGLGNLGAALVGSCPINGSVSRTSMTEQFESKSQLSSMVAGTSMLVLLCSFTGFIQYLPVPVLTGIVMAALLGIIDIKLAKRLYKVNKVELFIFLAAFFGVLIFGTVAGVIIGVCLSFVDVLIRTTKTPHSLVGVVPGKSGFHSLERNSGAREIQDTVIFRFRGSLFFANVERFETELEKVIKDSTRNVIIDASGINDIDMSACDELVMLNEKLKKKEIRFFITEHKGVLNDQLRRYGAETLIEEGVVRRTISAALRDVHLYPPYPLVENTEEHVDEVMRLENRSLMEFEWAYGKDAGRYMEMYAKEIIDNLSEQDISNLSKGWYLEHNKKRRWKKLGHVDEEVLLYHLEMHLKEMSEKLGATEVFLEEALEQRRQVITERLKSENGFEYQKLINNIMKMEQRMKKERPKLYEEIIGVRKRLELERDMRFSKEEKIEEKKEDK